MRKGNLVSWKHVGCFHNYDGFMVVAPDGTRIGVVDLPTGMSVVRLDDFERFHDVREEVEVNVPNDLYEIILSAYTLHQELQAKRGVARQLMVCHV